MFYMPSWVCKKSSCLGIGIRSRDTAPVQFIKAEPQRAGTTGSGLEDGKCALAAVLPADVSAAEVRGVAWPWRLSLHARTHGLRRSD